MSVDVKVYDLESILGTQAKRVLYSVPEGPGIAANIDRLFQQIVKSLLTTPGSDKFHPNWGGGLQNLLPAMVENGDLAPASRDQIYFAVSKVQGDILRYQQKYVEPPSSTLRSLNILNIELVEDGVELTVLLSLAVKTADSVQRALEIQL